MEQEKRPCSALSLAYETLWELQEKSGRYITYEEAGTKLQCTRGITFGEPGTTPEDFFNRLADRRMVALDSIAKRILVLAEKPREQS